MKTRRRAAGPKSERGLVITLVAVVLLFVVGAMAVLAIDVATFYTARSEAQIAADGAALAGARILANSGTTSNTNDTNLASNAQTLASAIATQVAMQNQVGGRNLNSGEISVTFSVPNGDDYNPQVTVQITRSDLPTFFARIWGHTTVAVAASATAEAYNPSGSNITAGAGAPVAPLCVKPWILPNISPVDGTSEIFDPATGVIQNASTLLGWKDTNTPPKFFSICTGTGGSGNSCTNWSSLVPLAWRYYPATTSGTGPSFPPPTQGLPSCGSTYTAYQKAIAGCVATPIACNQMVNLDQTNYSFRNRQTAEAVNCLTDCQNSQGDQVAVAPPNQSFQFLGGVDDPIPGAAGKNMLVSNSLVTVPVYNSTIGTAPLSSVQIIGFVQLFLNWDGLAAPEGNPDVSLKTTIVNLVGCGTNAAGQPIYGNGPSPVAVRLIKP